MRREEGFSLLEVMVAIAIMMVLIEAVAVAYVHMFSQSKRSRVHSTLDEQSKFLGNYLTYRLQGVGGGAVRPWASVWTEDNCIARGAFPGCGGSDRVTTATLDALIPECTIVATPAASTLQIVTNAGVCCLTGAHANKQAVISNGSFFSQVYLTNVNIGACTIDFAPGAAFGGLDNSPAVVAGWINGRVTVTDVATLYLDSPSHELREFRDINFNLAIDAGEEQVLADQIFDLQVALGYDANPRDGRAMNMNDDNDEWLFNSNLPLEGMGLGGLIGGVPSDLRMLSVGLILGDRVPGPQPPGVTILNGPPRNVPEMQLTRSQVRFRFRNIGIFLSNG